MGVKVKVGALREYTGRKNGRQTTLSTFFQEIDVASFTSCGFFLARILFWLFFASLLGCKCS